MPAACARARKVIGLPSYESSASYPCPATTVFSAAAQAVQSLPGWKALEVNQAGWYITASVSFNFWSYGENITINVTEPTPGQPSVNVFSSSKFALVDFGKNRSNVRKFFAELQNALAAAGCVPPQAAAYEQVPASAQHQAGSFCTNCGAPQRASAGFCTSCGEAMMPG